MPYKLTGISGSLWRFPWGVRRRLVLGHGTLLPSRGGKGVSGLLSSWGRDQGLFVEVPWGSQASLRVMSWSSGWHSSRCRGMRPYLDWMGTSGSFRTMAWPLEFLSSFKVRPASSWGATGTSVFLLEEAGEWTLISSWEGETGVILSCGGNLGVPLEWRRVCQGTSWVA